MRCSTRCSPPGAPTPSRSSGSRSASTRSRPCRPGRVDAATAFWNAEGVALRRLGVPTREFRVDDFGAPPYPELVLVTTARTVAERPELVEGMRAALEEGQQAVLADPDAALADLLEAVPELSEAEQRAQLDALLAADAIGAGCCSTTECSSNGRSGTRGTASSAARRRSTAPSRSTSTAASSQAKSASVVPTLTRPRPTGSLRASGGRETRA